MIALLVLAIIGLGIAGLFHQFSVEARVARIERRLGWDDGVCCACRDCREHRRVPIVLPLVCIVRDPVERRRSIDERLRASVLTRFR